jgi:hypothetical protein
MTYSTQVHIHVLMPFLKRRMQINLVYHSSMCYHLVDTFYYRFNISEYGLFCTEKFIYFAKKI